MASVPGRLCLPVAQPGIVLPGAREPALVRALVAYLGAEPARAILARFGHGLPERAGAGRP